MEDGHGFGSKGSLKFPHNFVFLTLVRGLTYSAFLVVVGPYSS